MEQAPPSFVKARVVAFSCILITSFLWVILLSLLVFLRWDASPSLQRSLAVILLLTNAITVILVPILLIIRFRVWLDIPRLLFLLVIHIGSAVAWTYCNASITCPNTNPDQEGVCKLINVYILLFCWVNPALLLAYAAGFCYMLYWRAKNTASGSETETESSIGHRSTQSMVQAERGFSFVYPKSPMEVPVYLDASAQSNRRSNRVSALPWLEISDSESQYDGKHSSPRLSKPPAVWTGSYAI